MPDSTVNSLQARPTLPDGHSKSCKGPVLVVGLYGLPGSGKTFLLSKLAQQLDQSQFSFYEGSQLIDITTPGGLSVFQTMQDQDKVHWRQQAIRSVVTDCNESGNVAVVTGHFMFWPEEQDVGRTVHTPDDLNTFTHIVYLDVSVDVLVHRRQLEVERGHPITSPDHL